MEDRGVAIGGSGLVVQSKKRVQLNRVQETADVIRQRWVSTPLLGMVLGTGMGALADEISVEAEFDYSTLPHFQTSTAIGHRGRLLCGRLHGVDVVAMDGRFHAYEGYDVDSLAYPIRVMQTLGAKFLIASNAAGALNRMFAVGDIMLIDDHINLLSTSATATPAGTMGHFGSGDRHRVAPYCADLLSVAHEISLASGIRAHRGVYVAMPGPNYETPAEGNYLRAIGGDAAGMSTTPEAIAAMEGGMQTLAFSVITNACAAPTDGHDVLAAAADSQTNVGHLVRGIVAHIRERLTQPAE